MPAPFRTWTKPDEPLAVLAARIEADLGDGETQGSGAAAYLSNKLYVEYGNNWQKGRMWPTQHPDTFIRERRLAQVKPMFAPVGILKACAKNQTDALLSREPTLTGVAVEPAGADGKETEAQQERGRFGLAQMTPWWDAVKLWDAVRLASTRASWATRAPLRLRMLETALEQRDTEDGAQTTVMVAGLSFADALSRITLETPEPKDALLHTDPETQEVCCIIKWEDENKQAAADVWYMDGDVAVRRVIRQGGASEDRFLGGALPLAEVSGDLLIGDAERKAQAQIDYTSTKLTYVLQYAAHREHYTIDAEPHGDWSPTPPVGTLPLAEREYKGQTWYLHPAQWDSGPEIVHELHSRVVETKQLTQGTSSVAAESEALKAALQVVDPVNPAFLSDALDAEEARLKRQMRQGHLMGKDKVTSGEKVKQDRADFQKQVESYQQSTELAVANILMTAGRIALLMTAPTDPMQEWFDEYRISCTLRIDTGPLSSEEIREETELADKGYKPRGDVMMSAARVDDVAVAEAAIRADPVQQIQRIVSLLEGATLLKDGWNQESAVQLLREKGEGLFSPELLAMMGRADFTGVTQ